MTYHTIMISMDLSPSADNRVKLAGSIADRFEASLIGVAARPFDPPIVYGDAVPPDPTLVENEKLRLREDFARVSPSSGALQEIGTASNGAPVPHCPLRSWPNRRGPATSSS